MSNDQPIRIQRKRTKGWRMPENTVYVGRGSKWGNPFVVGRYYANQRWIFFKLDDYRLAVHLYREYITGTPEGRKLLSQINELRGKNLACWCKENEPCHADVLLKLANDGGAE